MEVANFCAVIDTLVDQDDSVRHSVVNVVKMKQGEVTIIWAVSNLTDYLLNGIFSQPQHKVNDLEHHSSPVITPSLDSETVLELFNNVYYIDLDLYT